MGHRFFVPVSAVQGGTVILEDQIARQITTVLRMAAGDHILVLDNSGWQMETTLTVVEPQCVIGQVVRRSLARGEPKIKVSLYQAMLKHYEVVADPARVRDPNRKGTVENGVKYTQNTALKGRKFESLEAQNAWLMHWEDRWASPRIHGRVKRQVAELFREERPYLQPLPLSSIGPPQNSWPGLSGP